LPGLARTLLSSAMNRALQRRIATELEVVDPATFDAAREVERSLKAFFMNRRFRAFFETGPGRSFYNERAIVDARGSTFKMDRVIVDPGLVQFIDYKTGEIRSDTHVEQVGRYGRLLSEVYPDREVRGFLLYLDDGEVVSI